MRLHYKGKFSGEEDSLPQREHPKNYVPFREPKDVKTVGLVAGIISIVLLVVLLAILIVFRLEACKAHTMGIPIGFAASLLVLLPHEFLHAICFKEDVYLYTNLKDGMLFVVGTEDMSKGHFIFMSLLPSIVFGLIPFVYGFCFPDQIGWSMFGLANISMGSGDFMNVWNALTQVPSRGVVYLSGFHSYWYLPDSRSETK